MYNNRVGNYHTSNIVVVTYTYIMFATRCVSTIHHGILKQLRTSNIGKELGASFENEIRTLLRNAGYRNAFHSSELNIDNVILNVKKSSSEFDAIIAGDKDSFGKFCDLFVTSYVPCPPQSDEHLAIAEVKLNAKLLKDWIKNTEGGSRFSFLNNNSTKVFTKILVINGGQESEAFVKSLSSGEDFKEYREVKEFIIKAKINVFHNVWASGEMFSDIISLCNNLTIENKVIKAENLQIKEENKVIKAENLQIKEDLISIKKFLHL